MVGFYPRFNPGYGETAAVLHGLKKKGVSFVWAEEHQGAVGNLSGCCVRHRFYRYSILPGNLY
jgi:hypothetical protein